MSVNQDYELVPYLVVKGASKAIDFYKKVFGATERIRIPSSGNIVNHAEILIGKNRVLLADEDSFNAKEREMMAKSPQTLGGTPVSFQLFVSDVDAVFKRALEAGAQEIKLSNEPGSGNSAGFKDPFGYFWGIIKRS